MSPFPKALASAQRRALNAELVIADERINELLDRIGELKPHLVEMGGADFDEVRGCVRNAALALARAVELSR